MPTKQRITTFLWYDGKAEEAATFYTSIFPDARITNVTRVPAGGPGPVGAVLTVAFDLAGQRFAALNGGPMHQFTPAISLVVNCDTQDEIDRYWDALLAGGGQPSQCGWLVDRYGVSWQVVPAALEVLLADQDPARAARVGQALMTMTKLDLDALRNAHAGQ